MAVGGNWARCFKDQTFRLQMVLHQNGREGRVALQVLIALQVVFSMPREVIGVKDLETRHRQQRAGKKFLAVEFDRFLAEQPLFFHRFDIVSGQQIAIEHDGFVSFAVEDDQVGGARNGKLVLPLHLRRSARVPHVIHRLDRDPGVRLFIFVQKRNDCAIERFVAVVIQDHFHAIRHRSQKRHRLWRQLVPYP